MTTYSTYEYVVSGNSTTGSPMGEYAAQILRGWPAEGARERTEICAPSYYAANGDLVQMNSSGLITLATGASRATGLVVRGPKDNTFSVNGQFFGSSNSNSTGALMSPAPTINLTTGTTSLPTWVAGSSGSGGFLTITTGAAHGLSVGQTVTIATSGAFASTTAIAGSYIVESVPSTTTFTIAFAANPVVTNLGTAGQSTVQVTSGNSLVGTGSGGGKAVVLWGNYIVATSNCVFTSMVPGAAVTANSSGQFIYSAGATTDLGYVLRVQGAQGNAPAYAVIVAF